MKGLYKYSQDFGRPGSLEGVFIADSGDIKEQEVYFGDVLGKHSEIIGLINKKTVRLVTKDAAVIKIFEQYNLERGFNPFHYLDEEE